LIRYASLNFFTMCDLLDLIKFSLENNRKNHMI